MTARRSALRSVKPGETPRNKGGRPRRKPTLSEAAASNDHRALLVALRTRIAKALEDPECKGAAFAALARRLESISKEIAAIDREAEADQEASNSDNSGTDQSWDSSAI